MATDPQQLLMALAGSTGLGQQIADNAQNQQINQRLGQQQIAQNDYQAQQQVQQEQSAQQFQRDVLDYNQDPTPQKLSALAMRYPQQAQNFTAAAKLKDDAQRNADLTSYGQIYNAAANGRKDLVVQQLQQRQQAMRAAGQDTTNIDDALQQLSTGGNEALKNVKGIALSQIYSHDPDGFSKAFNLGDKSGGTHVIGAGGALVGDDGKVLYQAGTAPEYRTIKNADGSESIVQVGGGGRASTGGAGDGSVGSGRYTGGWTPRQRNGGDNSDAAVDSKIAGMSKALGIDPDAPLTAMSAGQIYHALTLSEGGAGSLADRNNNHGNLRDAKTGAYRKFASAQAGDQAGIAQVQRNLARGQNTIRSMVEGLPVGGSSGAASSGGGAQVLYTSKAGAPAGSLDDDTKVSMAQQYLAGDKSVLVGLGTGKVGAANRAAVREEITKQARAQNMTGAQIAAKIQDFVASQKTLNAFDAGKEAGITRSLNVAIDHLDTLQNAAQALQNGQYPIFNKVAQSFARATGKSAPTNFETTRQIVAGEVAKVIAGGNSALADRQDLVDHIRTSGSPEQLAGYVSEAKKLLAGQLHGLAQQYQTGTGRNDFAARLSPRTKVALGYGAPTAAPTGFRILSVRPK